MEREDYLKDFGKRIADRRKQLGMSQDDLAKKLGYKSRSTINKIELGKNDIPQRKILEFSAALDMPVSELMAWEQESKSYDDTIEEELITLFRQLTATNQEQAIWMIKGLLIGQDADKSSLSAG